MDILVKLHKRWNEEDRILFILKRIRSINADKRFSMTQIKKYDWQEDLNMSISLQAYDDNAERTWESFYVLYWSNLNKKQYRIEIILLETSSLDEIIISHRILYSERNKKYKFPFEKCSLFFPYSIHLCLL